MSNCSLVLTGAFLGFPFSMTSLLPKVGLALGLLDAEISVVFLLVEAKLVRGASEVEGVSENPSDERSCFLLLVPRFMLLLLSEMFTSCMSSLLG